MAERVRPSVPRAKLHALIASSPPRVIGMDARSGVHHWARLFRDLGHTARLTLHRTRQGFVEQRAATLNRIRGLPSEFGVVLPLAPAMPLTGPVPDTGRGWHRRSAK